MTRLLVSALALGLAVVAATPAFANSIWTEDCNLTPQSSFGFNEAVCAQGDLDSPCLGSIIAAADIWIMPSGAPDFTLAPGSLPSRIVTAGGAGGFWGEYIWLPPLVPGTYDLLIDEACNGTWNADDLRVNGAFVVNNVDTGVVVDVAAIKGDALQQAAEWGQIRANFNLMVDVVSLIGKLNTFVSALGGDFSGVIGWIYGKVTGLPTDYNGAVLQIGKEIVGGMTTAMETHFILLALDPPDPDYEVLVTLDWSVLEPFTSDEGLPVYPFAPQGSTAVEAQSLRLAGVLAEQAVLGDAFVRSLEKYQGADQVTDNAWIHQTATRTRRYALAMLAGFNEIEAELEALEVLLAAEPGAALTLDPAAFEAIQERVAADGLDGDELELLELYGLDAAAIDAFVAATLAQDLPDVTFSPLSTVQQQLATIPALQASWGALVDQLDAVIAAEAPYVVPVHPVAHAGGPYAGQVGVPVQLSAAASTDPDGDPLSYAWDLDADGEFDDGSSVTVSLTPPQEGRWLVAVRITDSAANEDLAWARLDATPSDLPPSITAFEPTDLEVIVEAGQELVFSVQAVDPEGQPLSYEWTVDDAAAGAAADLSWTPSAAELGLHRVRVQVTDGGAWSRPAYEQRQILVVAAGGDDDDAADDDDGADDDDSAGDDDDGATDDDDAADDDDDGRRPGGCGCETSARTAGPYAAWLLAGSLCLGLLRRRLR